LWEKYDQPMWYKGLSYLEAHNQKIFEMAVYLNIDKIDDIIFEIKEIFRQRDEGLITDPEMVGKVMNKTMEFICIRERRAL